MIDQVATKLPPAGDRIAIVGCGTSFYIAQAVAVARESRGFGQSDAFVASEMPTTRTHDSVIAISRSGTTTEVCGSSSRFMIVSHMWWSRGFSFSNSAISCSVKSLTGRGLLVHSRQATPMSLRD